MHSCRYIGNVSYTSVTCPLHKLFISIFGKYPQKSPVAARRRGRVGYPLHRLRRLRRLHRLRRLRRLRRLHKFYVVAEAADENSVPLSFALTSPKVRTVALFFCKIEPFVRLCYPPTLPVLTYTRLIPGCRRSAIARRRSTPCVGKRVD